MIVETMTFEEVVNKLSSSMTHLIEENCRYFRDAVKELEKEWKKNKGSDSQISKKIDNYKDISYNLFACTRNYHNYDNGYVGIYEFVYTIVHLKKGTYYCVYNRAMSDEIRKGVFLFVSSHAIDRLIERSNIKNMSRENALSLIAVNPFTYNVKNERGKYKDNFYYYTTNGIFLSSTFEYSCYYDIVIADTFISYDMMYEEQKSLILESIKEISYEALFSCFNNVIDKVNIDNVYSDQLKFCKDISSKINADLKDIAAFLYESWKEMIQNIDKEEDYKNTILYDMEKEKKYIINQISELYGKSSQEIGNIINKPRIHRFVKFYDYYKQ